MPMVVAYHHYKVGVLRMYYRRYRRHVLAPNDIQSDVGFPFPVDLQPKTPSIVLAHM